MNSIKAINDIINSNNNSNKENQDKLLADIKTIFKNIGKAKNQGDLQNQLQALNTLLITNNKAPIPESIMSEIPKIDAKRGDIMNKIGTFAVKEIMNNDKNGDVDNLGYIKEISDKANNIALNAIQLRTAGIDNVRNKKSDTKSDIQAIEIKIETEQEKRDNSIIAQVLTYIIPIYFLLDMLELTKLSQLENTQDSLEAKQRNLEQTYEELFNANIGNMKDYANMPANKGSEVLNNALNNFNKDNPQQPINPNLKSAIEEQQNPHPQTNQQNSFQIAVSDRQITPQQNNIPNGKNQHQNQK